MEGGRDRGGGTKVEGWSEGGRERGGVREREV